MPIVGFPYLQNFLIQRLFNFHSTASSKFREKLFTSVFAFQECVQLITRYFLMYTKPTPLIFIQNVVDMLSHITLTCL